MTELESRQARREWERVNWPRWERFFSRRWLGKVNGRHVWGEKKTAEERNAMIDAALLQLEAQP